MMNLCKNKKWPNWKNSGRVDTKKLSKQYWEHTDLYFTYDLSKIERGKYLNTWFKGQHCIMKNDLISRDEMITLKEVDSITANNLYNKKYNPISIDIMCPASAKFNYNIKKEPLYHMKAQIHSIDDSSYGIWWDGYYSNDDTFENLSETRIKIMEWVNTHSIINGEEFLNMCIGLGASEYSKDYN